MDRRRLARIAVPVAVVAAVYAVGSGALRVVLARRHQVGEAIIDRLSDDTTVDPVTGAVRSIQSGDVQLPEELLQDRWSPMYLERLARTYWRFLTRVTLGLVRVKYTDRERFVVLLFRPLELLAFHAPEYEMDGSRGVVRWRIKSGVLVAGRGHEGDGYLEIDVQRYPSDEPGRARVHVEIEVANFYPAIASRLSRFVYANTQSRIHVIVTHGFLRSLARLDLEESRVGRFVAADEVPDPSRPPPSERHDTRLAS
jgi:hypothetical protein